jgi:hypothetical protein
MKTSAHPSAFPGANEPCTVVVLYDNDAARTRAMTACDFLVSQFWDCVEMEFHWWRTDFLIDPVLRQVASGNALDADFFIVSCELELGRYTGVKAWFESWVDLRDGPEGALVDLQPGRMTPTLRETAGNSYLVSMARRGRFDYLTSLDAVGRVDQAASNVIVAQDAFKTSRPPTHYGLNE